MYQIVKDLDHQARNIQWLEFELSNNCQYARVHTWCPRFRDDRPLIFLRSRIVHEVVQFFKQYNFSGRVYFSGYSEPLIDPRLTELVRYTREHLPKCHIDMFTNGVACDENLLMDVFESGVDRIWLSIYTDAERERLGKIAAKIGSRRLRLQGRKIGKADVDIDDRINIYNKRGIDAPCFIPTLYYFVRNTGEVNMCPWDWKYTKVFGNLYTDSIESTLMNEDRLVANNELVNGNRRVVPVCRGCDLPTDKCVSEYRDRMRL